MIAHYRQARDSLSHWRLPGESPDVNCRRMCFQHGLELVILAAGPLGVAEVRIMAARVAGPLVWIMGIDGIARCGMAADEIGVLVPWGQR